MSAVPVLWLERDAVIFTYALRPFRWSDHVCARNKWRHTEKRNNRYIRYWRGSLNRVNTVKLGPILNTETSRRSVHVGAFISSSNQADLFPQNLLPNVIAFFGRHVLRVFCLLFCLNHKADTRNWAGGTPAFSVNKKKQLDVTFCILYFSSNCCSTCFGQPCAHHQELTTAWCYSLVLVCTVAAGRWSSPVGR